MNAKGPLILVTLIMTLTIGAAAILIAEALPQAQSEERGEEFQRLVGGLGFGPAVDLAGCVFSFDPRLCDRCPYDLGPIPGGAYFCPHHGCSILYYQSLGGREVEAPAEKHGEVP